MPQANQAGPQSESALRIAPDQTVGLQCGGQTVSSRTGLPGGLHQRCQRPRTIGKGREYGDCLVNYSDTAYRVFHELEYTSHILR